MVKKEKKKKKSRHLPKGYMCQMGNESTFREKGRRNNRRVNTSVLLLRKFLNGKNLFNDQFHIIGVQVKNNMNPF